MSRGVMDRWDRPFVEWRAYDNQLSELFIYVSKPECLYGLIRAIWKIRHNPGERFDLQTVLNAEFIGLDSVIVGTSYGHGIFRQTVYSEVTNGHRVVGWNPTVDGWYQELGMLVGLVQEANRGNGRGFQYVGHDMDDDAEVIIAIACND